jgi:hypothetical protein
MQKKETGTWLTRSGDGWILEVDAGGYPGAEASPGDGRAVGQHRGRACARARPHRGPDDGGLHLGRPPVPAA